MAHSPLTPEVNGLAAQENGENGENGGHDFVVLPGKRKRDISDDGDDPTARDGADSDDKDDAAEEGVEEGDASPARAPKDQKQLIRSYFEVLTSLDPKQSILKRHLPEPSSEDEPQAKRQKSVEPSSLSSIADKVAADAYAHIDDVAADVLSTANAALAALEFDEPDDGKAAQNTAAASKIRDFRDRAEELRGREKAYPQIGPEPKSGDAGSPADADNGVAVLSLVGYAPQERRLFSSLPLSRNVDLSEATLPTGVSVTRVLPSKPQERTQTLGELFAPPRALPSLQPPKQPKTQAKGNTLDFYHPELTDKSKYRSNTYFSTKLSAGYYLDYSNATPSSQTKTKQRERAQSLAGKKPSTRELEVSEMESLFRGAFSSFAPCKDDSSATVPSNVAGRMWWQKAGQRNFQRMIEVEYYGDAEEINGVHLDGAVAEVDEVAVQEAIDSWDDTAVDPSLSDIMGSKRDDEDKEADDILDEVSDMIETLASYQRIRNLTLPNSQNRQSSDPVNGDMLATSGPQPSEEEQTTYQVLKAQLALIVKTLPPYAVAKLNGDQLDELLISTKLPIQTDQYKGTMEEDDAGVQARLRAQQAAAQAAAARPQSQRSASMSTTPYGHYPGANQYGTPTRTPSQGQAFYRPGVTPNYQPPRSLPPTAARPQPNQYSRPNGYPNQYATQLAKAQTPYGHQNMPQYASQQRMQYGQMPQQGTPNARFPHQAGGFQGTPTQGNFAPYTNGSPMPQRTASPQVAHRQTYTPTLSMQQNQRYGTPNASMSSQMNRFSSNSHGGTPNQSTGPTGYHTVIPEAQQQRILDQAKARVAAQERSAMFADKIAQPGMAGLAGIGLSGLDMSRLAAARASFSSQTKPQSPGGSASPRSGVNGTGGLGQIPHKVTPVPVPPIPGSQQQSKPAT